MKLRRLTESGITQFGHYLEQLKAAPTTPPPSWLLTDEAASQSVSDCDVTEREFASRFDVAAYLGELMNTAGLQAVERDVGLWAWLSLFHFDQVCPPRDGGERKPGERARHIPDVQNF
jgi:hypothetical protein